MVQSVSWHYDTVGTNQQTLVVLGAISSGRVPRNGEVRYLNMDKYLYLVVMGPYHQQKDCSAFKTLTRNLPALFASLSIILYCNHSCFLTSLFYGSFPSIHFLICFHIIITASSPMPPKKVQAKKGPTYKTATPLKDITPATVKEPRESKPCKVPESFPDPPSKNAEDTLSTLFAEWPTQQNVKSHDFGINSEEHFNDMQHDQILEYLKNQIPNSQENIQWKRFHELQAIRQKRQKNEDQEMEEIEEEKKQNMNENEKVENEKQANNGEGQGQGQAKQEQKKKELVVIETYMREQTEEEMERRKRDQAEKAEKAAKDKKKGKKQEPKQEGPIQVSDVAMANVCVKQYMCPSGIWIGSQLQIIKARQLKDIYTEDPVWKNIHPQENGVPQITKSGKYWVKLFYMGKAIKVEVDDRVPLDNQNRQLFPTSEKQNEVWTLVMTKALVKYFSLVCPKQSIIGSGLIMYALTGLITQNIPLRGFGDWKKIEQFMTNQHYQQKDIMMSCFNHKGSRKNPSNYIKSAKDIKGLVNLQNSTFKKKSKKRISQIDSEMVKKVRDEDFSMENEIENEKIEEKFIDNLVISGYSYCIGDYFSTDGFNMVFSKQKSGVEQKLRMQYNEMSKVSLTNKTRDEKLEHRRKKKQIKQKLLAEEKKRIQEISKPLVNYHFLKLLGNININCQYSHRQILLAKRCVLNNISQPPNYEIPNTQSKQQLKSSVSQIKFKQDSQVNIPLDDFGPIENAKQLFNRADEGVWIKDQDLLGTFDELQILYNPNVFENKTIQEIPHQIAGEFSYDENKQILVIEKKGNPHQQNEEQMKENEGQAKEEFSQEKIKLLFGFSFQDSKWDTLCSPYCMLQKFDFDAYRTTNNITTLNSILSSTYLTLNNQNSVFKIYTMSKGRYAYWISSNSPYKMLSIADYLTEYEGYSSQNFTVEYGPLQQNCYQTLYRIKISNEGDENNAILLKMKNCPKQVEKFLNYKVVAIPESGIYTSQQTEGVIKKDTDSLLMCYQYSRAQLLPKTNYYILVQAYPSCNIPDGTFDLVVLSKQSSASIQQVEQIQPYKFVEKYQPNKYANIFRERIFCNQTTNASFVFKVVEGEEGQPLATDKKASKKGGKDEPAVQIIQKPLEEKRLIHVKVLKNGNLVYYAKGYNQVIISNISIDSTKDDSNEYYIEASFDLREWPEAGAQNEENNRIYWSVQISGEESVAFAKDTLKEDRQKETRKSWEDNQTGRAEKAKKARQRYLLELKKERGQQLTQQEMAIVNAPRMTKKQLLQEEKKNEDKKGGKGAKKDDKKGAKKQEIVEEKKEERPLPKSEDNFMTQIKEFIKNLQSFQVKKIPLQEGNNPRIRSAQQQNAIQQGAKMAKQNKTAQIVRSVQMRQTMKIQQKDKKDRLTILLEDTRNAFIEDWKKYISWRIEDQEKEQARQEKERAVIEIIKQQKQTISQADLEKMITQYKGIEGHNPKLADVAERIRKNIKIGGIVEKMNNMLAGWEVDQLKALLEQIKNEKVEGIESEVMGKVNEMMQQAANNPNLVAEKQAQLKKGGKKGGKK